MQMRRFHVIVTVLVLSFALSTWGCTRKPKKSPDPHPKAGPATSPGEVVSTPGKAPTVVKAPAGDQKTVVAGANGFALDLYTRLRQTKGNLFFSPWSINTALGMTYAGARGTTATQMAKAMHYTLGQPQLHPAIGAVQRQLAAAKGYELAVANRVFPKKGLSPWAAFSSVLRSSYGSTLQQLDYQENPNAARKVINAWVKKQTRDRIPELLKVPDIKSDTRLVLVNAIYFKGSWASKFDKKNTKPLDFGVAAGKKVKTPTMVQQGRFGYRSTPDVDVLEMGYTGQRLSMVVLLPKKVNGLSALEKSLTAQRVSQLTSGLRKRKVRVFLPRFKMGSRFDLKKQLVSLGMSLAFTDQADFSGITPREKIKISKVIHQANCDVTEQGTVAAAATAVVTKRGGSAARPVVPVFRADHPFVFLIRDQKTGAILFLGRLVSPK